MTTVAIDPHRFEFIMYPNPPLSSLGFTLVIGSVAILSCTLGAAFVIAGAWPVMPFFGLDVVALWVAFRWVRRQARRFEIIKIDRDQLLVQRTEPNGRQRSWRFTPYWARVTVRQSRSGTAGRLSISERGKQIEIGRFLTLDEKRDLAHAVEDALAHLR